MLVDHSKTLTCTIQDVLLLGGRAGICPGTVGVLLGYLSTPGKRGHSVATAFRGRVQNSLIGCLIEGTPFNIRGCGYCDTIIQRSFPTNNKIYKKLLKNSKFIYLYAIQTTPL